LFCAISWLVTGLGAVALVAALAGRQRRSPGSAGVRGGFGGRAARCGRRVRPLISSARAGMSLPDAVAALATSGPPLRPAFDRFRVDMAASGHFDSSALRLKAALADPVADRIIETLRMARQVGGTELTAVLRALSASVRADATLRAEVEARQSWVRGAAVVGVVAPWIVLGLLALRPEGASAYASPAGVAVIIGAVVSVGAYRLTIRIGRLPEPRRWFA
jgi:tight adherence protein B